MVIATVGRGEYLAGTLRSIASAGHSDVDLVIVDQGGDRGGLPVSSFAGAFRDVVYVELPIASLPLARNVGLGLVNAEIVVFCDDDVLVAPGFLEAHRAAYSDPSVGAVAGRVLTESGTTSTHGTADATGRLLPDGSFEANFDAESPAEVDFGLGCNMSFRADALRAAGGFDERYTGSFYREEGDAFARVKRLGYRVVFAPDARLTHLQAPGGGCRTQPTYQRLRSVFRNETLFFLGLHRATSTPSFLWRLTRWIYAEVRAGGYGLRGGAYFAAGPPAGILARLLQHPRRLSRAMAPPGVAHLASSPEP